MISIDKLIKKLDAIRNTIRLLEDDLYMIEETITNLIVDIEAEKSNEVDNEE